MTSTAAAFAVVYVALYAAHRPLLALTLAHLAETERN